LVYLKVILGHVVSKARKLPDLEKILAIVNMLATKTFKDIQNSMGWPSSTSVLSRTLFSLWALS
jgi:hypothetical protein